MICHLEMIIDAICKSNLIKQTKKERNPFERLLHVLPSIRMKLELLFATVFEILHFLRRPHCMHNVRAPVVNVAYFDIAMFPRAARILIRCFNLKLSSE